MNKKSLGKLNILHVVGGKTTNGAFKGAYILHKALLKQNVKSKIINDTKKMNSSREIVHFDNYFFYSLKKSLFIFIEKILKKIFLHSPRETFTLNFFGNDLTKYKNYKKFDIIHIHWLSEGFISIKNLSKIKKPVVWTMRDMWAFTSGSHYTMDFNKFEKSYLSKLIKLYKKKHYNLNFKFVAPSNWLLNKAKNSLILNKFNIDKINNNIDINDFKFIGKDKAKKKLKIKSNKKIILYGAQNPQSKRKGWKLFLQTMKKLDKKKYFLLIFGNFWSHNDLEKIGIEYKSLGFIHNINKLNAVYSCADLFVASSIQDAWPKTFAEAMCCNIPVICFDKTSISEIVEHKKTGFIVKNFSSAELKKSIEWVSQNLNSNLLNNRRNKNLMNLFDSKLIAKKYIKLYESLLAN